MKDNIIYNKNKYIFVLIKILAIITVFAMVYFIIFGSMQLINNSSNITKILIDSNLYSYFYKMLNFISSIAFLIFLILIVCIIPYIVISIILSISFIKRYISYKGEKKNRIIKIIIFTTITFFILFVGIFTYPISNKYVIEINKNTEEISNTEIKKFIEDNIGEDEYIYKINITRGFPNDYNVKIYYNDVTLKERTTFLTDIEPQYSIMQYATDITNRLIIKSIIVSIIGSILYIFLVIYVINELKTISE